MIAHAPVPGTNWILIGTIEKEEFFSGINRMIKNTVIIGIMALVVAVIMVLLLVAIIIIRPVKSIMKEADALANM
jgi:ABC-type Fe3+ transport system permease subunit